jgi:hypothetical protein
LYFTEAAKSDGIINNMSTFAQKDKALSALDSN